MGLNLNSQTLELVSNALCDLFENQGFNNISVTNDPDFLELVLSDEREDKFPAIILRGPEIDTNIFTKRQGLYSEIITKNLIAKTFTSKKPPAIVDVIYNIYIIGEEHTEVLNSIINILAIFNDEVRITAEDIIYRVYLVDDPDFSSDIEGVNQVIYAVGTILIEGVEIITSSETETGNLMEKLDQNTEIMNS